MSYANKDFAQLLAALVPVREDTNHYQPCHLPSLCPVSDKKELSKVMIYKAKEIAPFALGRDSSSWGTGHPRKPVSAVPLHLDQKMNTREANTESCSSTKFLYDKIFFFLGEGNQLPKRAWGVSKAPALAWRRTAPSITSKPHQRP